MRVNRDDISGNKVKCNETYTVIDNVSLKSLVVSKTILHPLKETGGHKHVGQEEVYQFVYGAGKMEVGTNKFDVAVGDTVLIPDGLFHKVWNTSSVEDLVFICVFDGKRSH
jgi:mannose-6-phosphate isomerase-like protein (cupin superfamily)